MNLRMMHKFNEMPRYTRSTRARTYSSWKGKPVRGYPINSYSYANAYVKPRKVWSRKAVGKGSYKGYKKKRGRRYQRKY